MQKKMTFEKTEHSFRIFKKTLNKLGIKNVLDLKKSFYTLEG